MPINETATGNDSVAIRGTASAGERTMGILGQGDSTGVRGLGKAWNGVEGISQSTIGGAGVCGVSDTGAGVRGISKARYNPAVHGQHNWVEGPGVQGDADNGAGVVGVSKTWIGVYGETHAPAASGAAAVLGEGKDGGDGVKGHASGQGKAAVCGFHLTNKGPGIFGKGSPAGHFEGNVVVTGSLTVQGADLGNLLQRVGRLEQQGASAGQVAQRVGNLETRINTLQQQVNNLQQQLAALQQKQAEDVQGIAVSLATLAARVTALGG
jgi:hypothetical protein